MRSSFHLYTTTNWVGEIPQKLSLYSESDSRTSASSKASSMVLSTGTESFTAVNFSIRSNSSSSPEK